jgi:hypothetical protein
VAHGGCQGGTRGEGREEGGPEREGTPTALPSSLTRWHANRALGISPALSPPPLQAICCTHPQHTIAHAIDEAVDCQRLALVPGILDHGACADVEDLQATRLGPGLV